MPGRSRGWKMIWNIPRLLKSSWSLLKNPQVSNSSKLLTILLGLGYFIWPFDLVPDLPLLGHLDDLGVIFLLLNWFVNRTQSDNTIEASYYFEDEQNGNK